MIRNIFLSFIVLSSFLSKAQNLPVFNHFYANPFQFNPSFIANNGYAEANLFYKQQFLGISNAPTVGALNIQSPVGRNVSLGFTAYSDKSILLTTSSALATFGYRARLGRDQHLNFGLSAGVGFNNFDFAALENTNDPALNNINQNNTFLNGQFGFNYHYKNFTIGFALPKLFRSQPNTTKSFNEIEFDEFRNKFGSVSYTFKGRNISVMPIAIYRALDNLQDQWEGALITTYKNVFWIGASYRTNYGITGMIGVNLKGFLRIGYAYEHPTSDISKVTTGSHEIYLGARLSKRNREEEVITKNENKDSLDTVKQEVPEPTKAEIPVVEEEPVVEEKTIEPPLEIKPIEKQAEIQQPISTTTYYVVIGVFKDQNNVKRKTDQLSKLGIPVFVLFEEEKNLYYLYVFGSANKEETRSQLLKLKVDPTFSDAWIYSKIDK